MKRIYVAGKYSDDDVMSVFGNMRRGIALSVEVLKAGYAPFTPWLDYHFCLEHPFDLQTMYEYSLAWLDVSDAVLVVEEGWAESRGTIKEIDRAKNLHIPVYWSFDKLKQEVEP